MIRTRVGYAGGSTESPTYRSIGDHSEAIQIEFDPSQVSYRELLDVFWSSHAPMSRPYSNQYASLILYHSEEQHRLALETKAEQEASLGVTLFTVVVPFTTFTRAEDYHQKYRLQQSPKVLAALSAIFPTIDDLVDSTAAARINGYVGGHGTLAEVEKEVDALALPPEIRQELLNLVKQKR